MRPGGPASCPGTVWHARTAPARHSFTHAVSYVWLDPDDPAALTDLHPLWSDRRPSPARFRAGDYGRAGSARSLAQQACDDLESPLQRRPAGPVRMLTQVRRWGWLFNPITVFVVWDRRIAASNGDGSGAEGGDPVGVVLEVTNTPWGERTRYAAALSRAADGWTTTIAKTLHVSPFLDERFDYRVALSADDTTQSLRVAIDVVAPAAAEPILHTALEVQRLPATRASLGRALRTVAPTHRVSAAIHLHAALLWRKRVPFVPHPSKRPPT